MKKFILMAATALLLAGCDQGGTGDQYNSGSGSSSSPGTSGSDQNSPGTTTTNTAPPAAPGGATP